MRRVSLRTGVDLAVHEHGEGVDVLFLHAWGDTHRTFDRLVPLLPSWMHLVVPDQRGVGDSAKPADGYTLSEAAEDVIALLDAVAIEACWLVGTSSGGYLAQQVAVDHPSRGRGLVLVGSPSSLHQSLPEGFADFLSTFHDPVTREDLDALNGALPLHNPVPLWGGEEDVLPAGQAFELQAAIADSRVVTYEGVGHLVLWDPSASPRT